MLFVDASTNYDRIKALHERSMVSQSEYDTAHLRLDNATIALEEAQLNLALRGHYRTDCRRCHPAVGRNGRPSPRAIKKFSSSPTSARCW